MEMPAQPSSSFQVGVWHVEPAVYQMRREGGERISVEPKIMGVLACLALRAGEPVTRQTLFETVWPDTVVTDDTLTRCISELRKIFGDDARAPRFIETLPRIGYRLLPPVQWPPPPLTGGARPVAPRRPDPPRLQTNRLSQQVLRWGMPLALLAMLGVGYALGFRTSAPVVPLPVRPLTTLPGIEHMPALAPEGERVAFIYTQQETSDLFVLTRTTGALLQLTDTPARESAPAWSPDGNHIAFVRLQKATCNVFIIPTLGGPERHLTRCNGGFSRLTWSPDGRSLVMGDGEEEHQNPRLLRLDVETGARTPLRYDQSEGLADYHPVFSPDGSRLLFTRVFGEGQADLMAWDLKTQTLQQLTFDRAGIAGVAWLPNGEGLIFQSWRQGLPQWWHLAEAGDTPTWLPLFSTGFGATVAGTPPVLVFDTWTTDSNLYAQSLHKPSALLTPIAHSTAAESHPAWSPDGKRLVFQSTRSGRPGLWLSDGEGQYPQLLPTPADLAPFPAQWSPDGQRLVFAVFENGQADLWLFDAFASIPTPPRRLTQTAANELFPTWSADGKWIYYTTDQGERTAIWKQSPSGDKAVQVLEHGLKAQEDPTGQTLYFTKEGVTGLWQYSLITGEQTQVLADLDRFSIHHWAITSGGLYYLDRSQGVQLLHVPFGTATPSVALHLPNKSLGQGLSLVQDRLLYTVIDHQEADLVQASLPLR